MKNISMGAQDCLYWYRKNGDGTVCVGGAPKPPSGTSSAAHSCSSSQLSNAIAAAAAGGVPYGYNAITGLAPESAPSSSAGKAKSNKKPSVGAGSSRRVKTKLTVRDAAQLKQDLFIDARDPRGHNPHRGKERSFNIFREDVPDTGVYPKDDDDIRREIVHKGQRKLDTVRAVVGNPHLLESCRNDDASPQRPSLRQCRDMWEFQKDPMRLHDEREVQKQSQQQKQKQASLDEKRKREQKFRWHLKNIANFKPSNRINLRKYPAHPPISSKLCCEKNHYTPKAILNPPLPHLEDRLPESGVVNRPKLLKTARPSTAKNPKTSAVIYSSTAYVSPRYPAADQHCPPADHQGVPVPAVPINVAPPTAPRRPQTARRPTPSAPAAAGDNDGAQQSPRSARPVSARIKNKIAEMADKFCL